MGIREKLRNIGPGVITGGADNDPAGVITYTLSGSLFGYSVLWVLLLATPMMIAVQEMASRIAVVTKKGISKIIRDNYGRGVSASIISMLAVANILTLGADTAAVSSVISYLTGVNWFLISMIITALIWYLILFGKYKQIKEFLVAITFLMVVYVISTFYIHPNIIQIAKGFIPNFTPTIGFVSVVIGILGTTISPYMLFWQSSEELEDKKKVMDIRGIKWDTSVGMIWSNLLAIFIIIASAAILYVNHVKLDNFLVASLPLKPFAGNLAFILFSIGIIFSGLIAIPVLAGSTAYATAEAFGWRRGLNKKVYSAKGFYFVFSISLFVGAVLLVLPINPIQFLFYTQVLDGFLIPFITLFLLLVANNPKIMRKYKNTKLQNLIILIFLAMTVIFDIILIKSLI